MLSAGSTCCSCNFQLKNWKITWYRDEPGDQTTSDAEYEDDDDADDDDDVDYKMHSCDPRLPGTHRCFLMIRSFLKKL